MPGSDQQQASFEIENELSSLGPSFGSLLGTDISRLAADGSVWLCGSVVSTNSSLSHRRRRLLQLAPTATVLMFTAQQPDVLNASLDLQQHLDSAPAAAGVYTAQLSGAEIIVSSLSISLVCDGSLLPLGESCRTGASSSSSSGLSNGAIAGIVVGAVVGAAALVCLLCLLLYMRGVVGDRDSSSEQPSGDVSQNVKDAPLAPRQQPFAEPAAAAAVGAATTGQDLSAEESEYHEYHTPEHSEVDPDQSSQLHIHV